IQPQVLSESSFSAPVEDVKPAAPDVPTIAPAVPLAPINCTDTDATASFPLGINQNEAGAVSIPDGLGGNAIFADFCLEGLGPNVLLEYYCSDLGALTSEKLNCPGICDSGACSIENIDPNATDPRRPTGTLDVPASSSSSQGTGGAPVPAPAPVAPVPAPVAPAPAPTVASPPPPPPPPPPPAVTTNSTLFITQKSNGLAGTATLGEQDVTLLAFEAVGGNEAINIIQTSFSAISGVESARNVNNYSLWADTNNDGAVDLKLQGNVQVNNAGVIAFSQLGNGGVGFTVGSSLAIRLEVHGNIGDTIRTANLQLQFALESQVSSSIQSHTQTAFLSGVQRNGSCPQSQCNTFLSTVEAKTFTITDGGSTPPPPPSAPQVTGSLEVRQDPTPFRNQFLLGGALSEPVFQLELTARTNPIALREIQIFDQSNDGGRSIDELGVFLAGQSQMIGYATRQSCPQIPTVLTNALFCLVLNNNELVLQPGVKTDLIFRAGVRMENQGGLYGDRVQLSVSPFTGAARAYDITANADLSQNDGDGINEGEIFIGDVTNNGQNRIIIGKEFDVSMSELASITNGSIDANGSFVPNSVSPLGTFTFTAKPNLNFNEVAISSLLFTVNATNVSIDKNSLKLYNVNSPLRMNCEAVGPGDTAISGPSLPQLSYVYCINIEQTDLVNDIRSGENIVLALEGDITDSNNSLNFSTSTLQVSLEHIDDRSTNFGLSPHSSLSWLDQDQPGVYKPFYHMNSVDSSVESTRYES
ncbi:MAG: hypothetical protein O2904_04915, partial [bacterium]|nr:hypothetical protein [bacterium]